MINLVPRSYLMAAVNEISGTIVSPELKTLGELRKGFTPFHEDDVIFAKITPCMQNGKVGRGTRAYERPWVRID